MKKRLAFLGLLFCFASGVALAGSQVRITNANDLSLGTWDVMSDMGGNDALCIYNSGGLAYRVTGTDNSTITPGEFRLENDARTAEIPYTANWGETSSPTPATEMRDGIIQSASGANRTYETCRGGTNANLSVAISAADLQSVPAGTYRATVSVRIDP